MCKYSVECSHKSECVIAAPPVWVTKPQDTSLEEGKPGYLHCRAKASPEPEVTWLRNNLMITPEVTYMAYFSKHLFHLPNFILCLLYFCEQDFKILTYRQHIHIFPQDTRFKLFRNGTLRINNVEVYDGQMYGCETKTLGGRLSGHARVTVLGELKGSLNNQ